MSIVFMLTSLFIFYLTACLLLKQNIKTVLISNISIAILIGYLAAILATFIHEGHPYDISCFKSWANMLYTNGLSNFYTSSAFTDYPPGYMYILYIIGAVRNIFNIGFDSYDYLFLIKSPAIIANIITGIFIYSIAVKKTSERNSIVLTMLYILNPMVLFNSSVWGQVDSVHTLTLVIAVYFITENYILESMLVFVICVFIKPQSFMFSPLYMYVFFDYLKDETDGFKHYLQNSPKEEFSIVSFLKSDKRFFVRLGTLCSYLIMCMAFAILLMFPFAQRINGKFNFMPVIKQYIDTLGSYNYATVNAYNIYGFFGQNWSNASETLFLNVPLSFWGTLALVAIVLFSLYLLNRSKSKSNIFFTAALINMCTFMFSIKMHERYSFPIMVFILMAYLYKMDKRLLYLYFGTTIAILINCIDVFRATLHDSDWSLLSTTIIIFSTFVIASFAYMMYLVFKVYKKNEEIDVSDTEDHETLSNFKIEKKLFSIEKTEPVSAMTGKDYVAMTLVVILYSIIAFVNLGNTKSPQTVWTSGDRHEFTVDLGDGYDIKRMQWFLGPRPDTTFWISISPDDESWNEKIEVTTESVFAWAELEINQYGRYVKLDTNTDDLMFMEMAFRDNNDNMINISNTDAYLDNLFDEQDLVPKDKTFMNSTYFDEIYHGRTAYEFVNKLSVYEWTHPPLGKVIISWGISLFGMTPFGWRFPGTLFGILMLPLIYLFSKSIFKKTFWAFFATFIFAFDFMHFTQTRICTIDTYITFFIIAMYYFMYRYWKMSYYDTPLWKTLIPLSISGLFMGLGIASKWPGVYAAVGLAALFFIVIYRRYTEYQYAKENDLPDITEKFRKYTVITLLCCVVFFIIIPAVIYFLSYIPYYATKSLYYNRENIKFLKEYAFAAKLLPDNSLGNYIAAVVQNQFDMFAYHSELVSEHDFASPWLSWPVMIRPIFYYAYSVSDTIKAGISSFGNPAVWWTGIVALFYSIHKLIKTGSKTLMFLIIAFFAQYIFWIPVTRTTYIYHYFPCTPFIVLLITYMFKEIADKVNIKYSYIYLIIVFALFVLFYPVLAGMPVYAPFVKYVLRWFPTWVFISY